MRNKHQELCANKFSHLIIYIFGRLVFGFLFPGKESHRSDFSCATFHSPELSKGISGVFVIANTSKQPKAAWGLGNRP